MFGVLVALFLVGSVHAAEQRYLFKKGQVHFEAPASVSAFSVLGKGDRIKGTARMRGTTLTRIRFIVPAASLTTQMGLRDEHMREQVFTTPKGKMPNLEFSAKHGVCTGEGPYTCTITGAFKLRGKSRTVDTLVGVSLYKDVVQASGELKIKLSDYGIARPSRLGIKVEDVVRVRFKVEGKAVAVR